MYAADERTNNDFPGGARDQLCGRGSRCRKRQDEFKLSGANGRHRLVDSGSAAQEALEGVLSSAPVASLPSQCSVGVADEAEAKRSTEGRHGGAMLE